MEVELPEALSGSSPRDTPENEGSANVESGEESARLLSRQNRSRGGAEEPKEEAKPRKLRNDSLLLSLLSGGPATWSGSSLKSHPGGTRVVDDLTKQQDGLHVSRGPILTRTLLQGERLPEEDDDIAGNEGALPMETTPMLGGGPGGVRSDAAQQDRVMQAAKITKRLLRDLAGECKDGKLRELWNVISKQSQPSDAEPPLESLPSLAYLERNPYFNPALLDVSLQQQDGASANLPADAATTAGDKSQGVECAPVAEQAPPLGAERYEVATNINLTDNAAGRFDMINDPVDEARTQAALPECDQAYGGQLGQWGHEDFATVDRATADSELNLQKYGHTTGVTDKYSRPRTILRVRVQQMCLLQHPYMSAEERTFVELKRIFAHYRALFEHRTILYLCHRLCSLITQMRTLRAQFTTQFGTGDVFEGRGGDAGGDDDDPLELLLDISLLYKDFMETLPLLFQVQTAMQKLSGCLYDTWKTLKTARQEQGFVSTKAVLTARELHNSRPRAAGRRTSATSAKERSESVDDRQPLLGNKRGSKAGGNRSVDPNDADPDDSDMDDDALPNLNSKFGRDLTQYREELRVFKQFTRMLSDDIPGLIRWIQGQLVSHERSKTHSDEFPIPDPDAEDAPANLRRQPFSARFPNRDDISGHVHQTAADKLRKVEERMHLALEEVERIVEGLRDTNSASDGNAEDSHISSGTGVGSRNNFFFPNVIFRLSNDGSISPDKEVPVLEQKRRMALACSEFTVRLRVNGELLTQQSVGTVNIPALTVHFNKSFELHVYHNPMDICADIYLRSPSTWSGALLPSSLSSVHVATVGVPLPITMSGNRSLLGRGSAAEMMGDAGNARDKKNSSSGAKENGILTAAYTPAVGWLQFSSKEEIELPNLYASGGLVYGSPDPRSVFRSDASYLQGAMYCSTEYSILKETTHHPILMCEGIHRSDLATLPTETMAGSSAHQGGGASKTTVSPESSDSTTALLAAAGSLSSNNHSNFDSSFAKERDFRALLPNVDELDIYDPRNEGLIATILHHTSSLEGDGRGDNMYFRDADLFRLYGANYSVVFDEEGGANGTGIGYSNFMKLTSSNRMKLLMLREYKPYLFTAPVPLSEVEIKHSEVYRSLLNSIPEDKNPPSALLSAGAGGLSNTAGSTADLLGRTGLGATGRMRSVTLEEIAERNESGEDLVEISDRQQEVLVDSLNGHNNKSMINTFLQRVRDMHTNMERGKGGGRKQPLLSTGNVVAETDYSFEFEFLQLEKLIPERVRALKPKPKARVPHALQVDECNVLVQVVGCRNVPLRVTQEEGGLGARPRARSGGVQMLRMEEPRGNIGQPDLNMQMNIPTITDNTGLMAEHLDADKKREKSRACTFVEVSFQENKTRTTNCLEGTNPLWKQSLSLPFHPPQNDFTPARLQQVRDLVYFTLFDEVIEDDSSRGGFFQGENTLRVERRYLGSFSIPFSTIYQEGKIEGLFRMDTPVFNFGYEYRNESNARSMTPAGSHSQLPPSIQKSIVESCVDSACFSIGVTTPVALIMSNITGGLLGGVYGNAGTSGYDEEGNPVRSGAQAGLRDAGVYMNSTTKAELDYYASDNDGTYIKLMITLDPLLVPPSGGSGGGDKAGGGSTSIADGADLIDTRNLMNEDRHMGPYASSWLSDIQGYSLMTKHRKYQLFGSTSSGQQTLLCRYLCPMEPPQQLGLTTRRGLIHLVSMIPFLPDSQMTMEDIDLWCTGKQLWELGCGDEEEHAVMLHNYLLYQATSNANLHGSAAADGDSDESKQGQAAPKQVVTHRNSRTTDVIEIYIVLGKAVPEGNNTVYVLLRDRHVSHHTSSRTNLHSGGDSTRPQSYYKADSFLLINPCNGFVYSAADPNCPLQQIYSLICCDNIYGNIQVSGKPSKMTFDVHNVVNWRPFFGSRFEFPKMGLASIQSHVDYVPTSHYYALDVEKAVRQAIKTSVRRWRSRRHNFATTFHPDASATMHDVLPFLEEWKKTGNVNAYKEQYHATLDDEGRNPNMRGITAGAMGAGGSDPRSMEIMQLIIQTKMKHLLKTRTMHGYPLNVPFTDVDEVIDKVRAVCIHEVKTADVQFVLAVRAFPLVNNMISLWVFLGSLELSRK